MDSEQNEICTLTKNFFGKTNEYWLLADQVLGTISVFLVTIMVARRLPMETFGFFAGIMLLQFFILTVQNSLVSGPYQVLHVKFANEEHKNYADTVFGIQSLFLFLLIAVLIILYVVTPEGLTMFLPSWWWIGLSLTGFLFQDYLRKYFISEGKIFHTFLIDAITSLIQLVCIALLFFGDSINFLSSFRIIGCSYIPALILGVYWLQLGRLHTMYVIKAIRLHLDTGKWLIMTAMLQWWSANLFVVAAGVFLGAAAFGAIRLAQNLFNLLNVVLQVFENYVVPNAADRYKNSARTLKPYLRSVSVKTGVLFVPLSLAIGIFARQVLDFLGGEQYESYAIAVQGLAVLQLLIFLSYPIRIAIRVLLLNKAFFVGYIITSIFSVLAARTFIQWGNIEGVIAGLLANQLLMLTYWQVLLHRRKFVIWR